MSEIPDETEIVNIVNGQRVKRVKPKTTGEMIERVSKAKWARRQEVARNAGVVLVDWDDELEGLRQEVRAETRCGIAAMREPTEDMLIPAHSLTYVTEECRSERKDKIANWAAMIDEVLK